MPGDDKLEETVSDLYLATIILAVTKNPIFADHIMKIVDRALVGDHMANAQEKKDLFDRIRALFRSPGTFDLEKAKAAAAAYAVSFANDLSSKESNAVIL